MLYTQTSTLALNQNMRNILHILGGHWSWHCLYFAILDVETRRTSHINSQMPLNVRENDVEMVHFRYLILNNLIWVAESLHNFLGYLFFVYCNCCVKEISVKNSLIFRIIRPCPLMFYYILRHHFQDHSKYKVCLFRPYALQNCDGF